MDPDDLDAGDTTSKFSDFFIFNAVIGKGAFGVVVSAISRSDNKEYAIKVIRKQNVPPKDWDRLRQEAMIHVELNHKNIVGFKYIKETENRIFLVMELVKGGQLKDLIDARFKSGRGFTDEEVSLIMKSIFSAVKHFHAKEIVHRDLKPENILVQDWEDLTSIKIADFGLSTQFSIDGFVRSLRQKCGTMIYMAPELALEEKYGKPVDIWSCGLVMYIMLSPAGNHPLYVKSDTPETFLEKLKNPEWTFGGNFSELAQNFFKKIMSRNPSARYTADEVEKHPWLSRRFDDEIPLSAHEVMNSFSLEQSFTRIMKALYITSDFIHREVGSTLGQEYRDLIDQNSEEQQRKKNMKRARLPRKSNLSDYDSLQSLLGITTNTISSPKSLFPATPNKDTRLGLSPTKETRTSTLLTAQDSIKTQESLDKSPGNNKSNMEEAKFFKETPPKKEEEEGLKSPDRNRFRIKSTSNAKVSDILPYTDFINTNQVLNNNNNNAGLPLKSKNSLSNKSDGSTAKVQQAFSSAMNGDMPDSPSTMKTEPEDDDDSLSEIKTFIGQSNTTRDRQHSSSTKVFMFKNIHTDAGFESDNVLANTKKNSDDSFHDKSMRSPSLNATKTAKFDHSNNTSYATDDSNDSTNDNPRALSSKELLKFPKKSPFYHNSVKTPSPNLAPLSSSKDGKLGTFSPKTFVLPMTPNGRKKHNESREFILPPITTPTQKRDGSLPRKKEEKNFSLKINPDSMTNLRSQQNTTPMNSNSKLITEPTDGLTLGLRSTPSISKKNFKSIQDFRAIVGFNGRDSTESLRKKGAPVIKLE